MTLESSHKSKVKRTYSELISNVKFNPESVLFKPSKELVNRLMHKHGLFDFNIDLVLVDIESKNCQDAEEVDSYIENISYMESTRCKYCFGNGCRICLGIDL